MGCIFGRSRNRKSVIFDRRRRVSVRIGSHIRNVNSRPALIFIFGGPGSRKGAIIENITSCFGFQHISIGDLIQSEMVRQRPSTIKKFENSREMKTMVEVNDAQYTMAWIAERISRRVTDDPSAVYLVDLIPNLKFMMKAKYLTEECRPALTAFDAKYPIAFAFNLAVPSDRLLQLKEDYVTANSGGSAGSSSSSSGGGGSGGSGGGGGGGMQETGGRGDEADTTKLQKRAGLYDDISKYLISYFTVNDTLVTVDVTGGLTSDIWHQVHQILCELNFRPLRTVGTVLVFEFDEADSIDVDMDKYGMDLVYLENVVRNPQESMENLLKSLSRYIDNSSSRADAFIVRTEGTTLSKDNLLSQEANAFRLGNTQQPLMFTDIGINYLENYLPGKPKNYVPRPADRKYKSVSSQDNEIYLFPLNTPEPICRQIAFLLAQYRSLCALTTGTPSLLSNTESFIGHTSPRSTDAEVRPLHRQTVTHAVNDKGSFTRGSPTAAT